MATDRLYLDYLASAPLSAEARRVLVAQLEAPQANPSSPHEAGRRAKDALESARTRIAKTLGCRPREVLFTSGATEAANLAIYGLATARAGVSRRVVVSKMEHPAVLEPIRSLGPRGFEVVELDPGPTGRVDPAVFLDAVGDDCAFAALMLANHEMGARMPVSEVGAALRERGIPFVCDAALGPGRIASRPSDLNADVILFSGHKFGAPAGVGFLYLRRRTRLIPTVLGGIQEERLRPGTPFVPSCMALAVALDEAMNDLEARRAALDTCISAFLDELDPDSRIQLIGSRETLLPGVVALELPRVEGEAVMINMDLEGISIATGSTCALGGADPSPSLLAMGFNKARAASTVRISVGEGVDRNSMKRAASTLSRIVLQLRALQQK